MHDDATALRFWAKVDRDGPIPPFSPDLGPCWVWIGGRFHNDKGAATYGMIVVGPKLRPAHRVAWELTNGPIPDGLWALHRCDNKPCVRPSHLYLGTHADNTRDAMDRNRMATRERHANAKLTEADVREIRRRWDLGETSYAIAATFRVLQGTISHIISGRNWRTLPGGVTRHGRNRSQTLSDDEVASVVAEYRAGGVSQAALARRVGVSRPTVSRWMHDRRQG